MHAVLTIVTTYNRCEMLQRCLTCLREQTIACDVLVIDNASTDKTEEWLKEYQQNHDVCVHRMKENIGGAGGFHFGVKYAAEAGYPYLWLMDDDCFPEPAALEKLIEADRLLGGPMQYGFLSSVVMWKDGCTCLMNRQKIAQNYAQAFPLLDHGLLQIEQASFVSLLLPAATVRKVGLPIADYFVWGDDIEFTRRIAVRSKLPCYLVGSSRVVHAMNSNCGSSIATDAAERISRYHYAYRNENHLYRKEGFRGFLYYTAKCLLNTGRILFRAKDHRLLRVWVILKEFWCGLCFNPAIETVPSKGSTDDEV